jgi:hypothetical protein
MNAPIDWKHPEWDVQERVHNWRNYVSEQLQNHWENMTDATKQIVAANLQNVADNEDWN